MFEVDRLFFNDVTRNHLYFDDKYRQLLSKKYYGREMVSELSDQCVTLARSCSELIAHIIGDSSENDGEQSESEKLYVCLLLSNVALHSLRILDVKNDYELAIHFVNKYMVKLNEANESGMIVRV